ncbi:MAG: 23S rRNA (pseudouridine(1915)-N(3))-methyltransferase RlmH [Phaeodactylibacter sp.]|nr:23S rRNA (pseudouridine(1915)-N(3))-methyltransferase RlmH [Phaeodactylibacter sp.]
MKVELWAIGKTNEGYLDTGIDIYLNRLKHYLKFEFKVIPDIKKAGKLNPVQLKEKEGALIIKSMQPGDFLILLDEKGKRMTSTSFADFIEHKLQHSQRRVIFLIGGAFGFSPALYEKADYKISLSDMTFSHQMIRLFMVEQIYRAMTILKNEPYHNN